MAEHGLRSSSFSREWTYDVFLNFRGIDTRFGFTGNLYRHLDQKGIRTFMDHEGLVRGEQFSPSLLKAIQESRIAITIFSSNYASSTSCLIELVQIIECIKEKDRLVLPVFYDLEPSVVRYQLERYREAFATHEERYKNDREKVRKWRQALRDAANLHGFHYRPGQEYEYAFIEEIVEEVSKRINRRPLYIVDHPVGLEGRVQQIKSLLDVGSNEGVQMVGICGIGGIGKTTIAGALYNLIADPFEGICFLAGVREKSTKHGLEYLQNELLSKIVGEDIKIVNIYEGIPTIKYRLQKKKVLLVLDDIDMLEQLQALAGRLDWFGSSSRIIITTRDKHLLARHGIVKVYEVESLNEEESLELLTWNAFGQNRVDPSYMENLKEIVLYASGLPLALEVIGSNLFNRGVDDRSSALDTYRRIPIKRIQQILQISYDALEEYEQDIFLDIACCFIGDTLEYITNALYARDICPDNVIKVLIDKCLIKIEFGHVTMHDLIQDMGREIVRQKSPKKLGERTRLWSYKDICQVLEENTGTEQIEAIKLDMPGDKEVEWNGKAFKKMSNLKILIIRNAHFSKGPKYLPNSIRVLDWKGYPYPSLPSGFYPKRLVIFNMPESCLNLDELFKKFHFQSLNVINFNDCINLRRVPDISGAPNLKELSLANCFNLTEVHDSIGFLDKLKRLSFNECWMLKTLPDIRLPSLESLDFSGCSSLERFPEILGIMENIRDVCLDSSGIQELPLSFRNLIGLQKLELTNCCSLGEVKGVPPNLKELSVVDPSCLSSESLSILLHQALHEAENLKFIIGINKIPDWFDHFTSGNSVPFWTRKKLQNVAEHLKFRMDADKPLDWLDHYAERNSVSFWVRKKLPNVAVCFGMITTGMSCVPLICIQINGTDIGIPYSVSAYTSTLSCPTLMFDLQSLVPDINLESLDLGLEWNHVEVFCVLINWPSERGDFYLSKNGRPRAGGNFYYRSGSVLYKHDFFVWPKSVLLNLIDQLGYWSSGSSVQKRYGPTWSGIYVSKKKFGMEDIRFTNPNDFPE